MSDECMETTWREVKSSLKDSIAAHSYRMWIEPLQLLQHTGGRVVLAAPNSFSRKRVLEHYGALIGRELERRLGSACSVGVEVAGTPVARAAALGPDPQLCLPNMGARPHSGRMLREDFTFDRFIVGGNNDFAYSAALCLASSRKRGQSALYLLSNTGMGKSHLTQAIGHHILGASPQDRVYYITAEDFSNEMVHAFKHDSIERFKNKYRQGCDVLLLEDVHHLSGKERTQSELAMTLDAMFQDNKKIIFSSCCPPSQIPKISDELRSRLSYGVISTIEPPSFRTRMRILQSKANRQGCQLPEQVSQYLASELTDDVRQLESGLIGVMAKSSLLGVPIDLSLAESVVATIVRLRKSITVESIKRLVCREYNVTERDVLSASRRHCYVRPRQIAIYLSRKYTDSPLQAIGKSFNRYHATALHSINTIEREIKHNATLQRQVTILCQKLEAGDF
jgi:chromosomal replication initiator protein